MNEGWKCPGCGTCYAPWVPKCDTCVGTSTTQWIPSSIVIQECEHVWGEPGTLGVTCDKCGILMGQETGIVTFTSTEGESNGND